MASLFNKILSKQNSDTEKDLKSNCPYCNKILDRRPQRKTKCQFCNKDIFVRSKQKVFPSHLLNAEDAMAVDWLKRLEDFGIKDDDFIKKQNELSKKFGQKAKSKDVIWGLFNGLISKTKNLDTLGMINNQMAWFLNEESKDSLEISRQSQKMGLYKLKESGVVKGVEILATLESCDGCKKLEGKKYTLDEALEKMPIPNPNCTYTSTKRGKPFCRCTYLPVLE